jgi:hypothetical protein
MERRLFLDHGERTLTFVNVQDVEPILDLNKAQRADGYHSDWGRHVARIPNAIMLQWFYEEQAKGNTSLQMYTEEFDRLIQRKLQDPDYAYLRTDRPALQAGWSAGLS